MAATDRGLLRLARAAGVATSYRDAWNRVCRVTPATLRTILGAMGFAAATPEEAKESASRVEAEAWRALLMPVVTTLADESAAIPLTLAASESRRLAWELHLEHGERRAGEARTEALDVLEGKGRRQRRALALGADLPPGYHRLAVMLGEARAETVLIVAPRRCHLPAEMADGRVWAISAQLHALRSSRNWGIGDFGNLATLAAAAGERGARVLGLNPLHALFPGEPRHISPYSPSSRLFLNPLYLDIPATPDFAQSTTAQACAAAPAAANSLALARASELIDYERVAALKRPIFAELYRSFRERELGAEPGERGRDFRRFQEAGGPALRIFATFTALHEHMLSEGGGFSWQDWPVPLRDARSPAVARFVAEHGERVELHEYLQWEADRQLAGAARAGAAAGLSVGFYRDLAVGVDPAGADAWADPAMAATGAGVGAPPDLLNLKGQDWGLTPVHPGALRDSAYAPFIAALRANMRHAGALRIDHVMALKHLYWIPRGAPPAQGTYVAYPFEDLRRIVALESQRQRCAVIGEDLGTVPAGFREAMAESGILSYRLMLFERDGKGGFLPPSRYPALATASFSTHDLPTLKGFWLGRDLAWRRDLDLYPTPAMATQDREERRRDRRRLLAALIAAKLLSDAAAARLLPDDDEPIYEPQLVLAVHRFLGLARSSLALMQIEDAVGELEQANLPGTVHEHPNWRRKLSLSLDQILNDPLFRRLTEALDTARHTPPEP
jgi:4-alpha-glucanotransferase